MSGLPGERVAFGAQLSSARVGAPAGYPDFTKAIAATGPLTLLDAVTLPAFPLVPISPATRVREPSQVLASKVTGPVIPPFLPKITPGSLAVGSSLSYPKSRPRKTLWAK